ncbi:zinc-ribbon domain-containing protein [Streptomyces sp. NPDC005571]|uniref:zinc-ribbon domain-containing protein n=1 Tax=Streptomyces sp. NPDC005571 TaxID=3156888 RepID=UPI0033B97154
MLREALPKAVQRRLSEHPVAKEFHTGRNEGLTADEVPYSWKVKVWWRCSVNLEHEWPATVNNRTKPRSTGCPACRGKRLGGQLPFERSLAGLSPAVAEQLNAERSGFAAAQVLNGSKTVAWWQCPAGHPDYDMSVNSRTHATRPQGCPYCARKRLAPEHSLAEVAPEVAEEFDAPVNGTTAEDIFAQDNRVLAWRCRTHPVHRWTASPNNRVGKGSRCPFCSGARVWDVNRLANNRPDIARQWDPLRNGALSPRDVSVGSSRTVHWVCLKGADHRWPASIYKRTSGQGCPFCAGNKVSTITSLLALRPDLAVQLDPVTSKVSAAELTVGSSRKVHWICPINQEHTWTATVSNRTAGGTGCPHCNIPGTSAQEVRLAAELSVVLPLDLDRRTIRTSKGIERVDMYIPALSLVMEFDGSYWHESTSETDAAKSRRLVEVVDHVVRIREHPLELLNPTADVNVPLLAPAHEIAAVVLDHLVRLGAVPAHLLTSYTSSPGPRAASAAEAHLNELRRRANRKAQPLSDVAR